MTDTPLSSIFLTDGVPLLSRESPESIVATQAATLRKDGPYGLLVLSPVSGPSLYVQARDVRSVRQASPAQIQEHNRHVAEERLRQNEQEHGFDASTDQDE